MRLMVAIALVTWISSVTADPADPRPRGPRLAVVMDDVGHSRAQVRRVLELPGPMTLAVLPGEPASSFADGAASEAQKEVILHQPMASTSGLHVGPRGLHENLGRDRFVAQLRRSLQAVPHSIGVSNHAGSRLTANEQPMRWLMEELRTTPLFFFDSRTTPDSVALSMARRHGIPAVARDVFLDHDPAPAAIAEAFQRAIRRAHNRGYAILIAHPYPVSTEFLRRELPGLAAHGVRQVALSELVEQTSANRIAAAGSGGQRTLR